VVKTFSSMKFHPPAVEGVKTVVLAAGDFHFGGGRTRISTLLGSCVSLTLWHPRRRIGDIMFHDASAGTLPEDEAAEWIEGWIALCRAQVGAAAST